jgi:hypothetical protein
MDSSLEPTRQQGSPSHTTLKVDFSWMKYRAFIADHADPSKPLYIVHFQTIKKPHLIFKDETDETTIGTGSLHAFRIDADFEVDGHKGELKAFKRWTTEYTHLSRALSKNGSPATMRWTSASDFTTWDFICVNDEDQEPVAKFSANIWAVRKVGNIEFMGPKAADPAVRDEIVVTGLTLFYCMLLRTSSILSFFGAIFARPGPQKDKNKNAAIEQEDEGADLKKD